VLAIGFIFGIAVAVGLYFGLERLRRIQLIPNTLADYIPWSMPIEHDTIIGHDDSLMACYRVKGIDVDYASKEQLRNAARRITRSLNLSSSLMVHVDSIRVPSTSYKTPDGPVPPVLNVLDRARKYTYEKGSHFENHTFISLTFSPNFSEKGLMAKLVQAIQMVVYSEPPTGTELDSHLNTFRSHASEFESAIEGEISLERLGGSDLVEYLNLTLNGVEEKITLPKDADDPFFLDLLCRHTLVTGFEPRLGGDNGHSISVVGITGYPDATTFGILDTLNTLDFPYRLNVRLIGFDKPDAIENLQRRKQSWAMKATSIIDQASKEKKQKDELTERITGDQHAKNMVADADEAKTKVASGNASLLHVTISIVLRAPTRKQVNQRARRVISLLRSTGGGFLAQAESGLSTEAFLGSLPMVGSHNTRRTLQTSDFVANILPLANRYAGPTETSCPMYPRMADGSRQPPLLYTRTPHHEPFRLSLFGTSGDVGHTMVVGPTGSGKSIFLEDLALRHMHMPGGKVFVLDSGGSFMPLCASLGGQQIDLANHTLSYQPLRYIDKKSERAWAANWIIKLVSLQDVSITPERRRHVMEVLEHMTRVRDRNGWHLQEFQTQIQDREMRDAMEAFTSGKGEVGNLLNGVQDESSDASARFQVYELGEMLSLDPRMVTPVLLYLFHRIERSLSPQEPSLIIADEFFFFAAQTSEGKEWAEKALRQYRKLNAIIVPATQEPRDLTEGMQGVLSACKTQVLLPNSKASDGDYEQYRALGLSNAQVNRISSGIPKREYMIVQEEGTRMIDLGLTRELAFLTAAPGYNFPQTALLIRTFRQVYGERDWIMPWFIFRGWVDVSKAKDPSLFDPDTLLPLPVAERLPQTLPGSLNPGTDPDSSPESPGEPDASLPFATPPQPSP